MTRARPWAARSAWPSTKPARCWWPTTSATRSGGGTPASGLAGAAPPPHEAAMAEPPIPPRPRKEPKRIEQLGRVRVDDYAWMKDDNWQAVLRDPAKVKADVREHLVAEN